MRQQGISGQTGASLALSLLLLGGCRLKAAGSAPAFMPSTPPPAAGCSRDSLLRAVDDVLTDEAYETHYLSINGMLSLSVWLVDPTLDAQAEGEAIAENSRAALHTGVALGHRLVTEYPCLIEHFDAFNPMIVDSAFNTWYIDVIPLELLSAGPAGSEETLLDTVLGSGLRIAYLRRMPTLPRPASAPDGCGWPEARADIRQVLGPEQGNSAAYLLVGQQAGAPQQAPQQVMLQISWAEYGDPQPADIIEKARALAGIAQCLSPPIDVLELYVVDSLGRTRIYGNVSGSAIRRHGTDLPNDLIGIYEVPAPRTGW